MSVLTLFGSRREGPAVERIRHEPRRRTLRVERSERVTPGMLRLTLAGDDLADFRSPGFDDHLKVFVPGSEQRRDYTPRRFDPATRTLAIDFAVHQGGAVTDWALDAKPGDTVDIGGPKGSAVLGADVRRWLLIGDETALPAIGRCIEEAAPGTEITSVVAVAGSDEEQTWQSEATVTRHWAHRPLATAGDPVPLLSLVRHIALAPETFIWAAAEAGVARAVRDHFLNGRGQARGWLKAGGYWVKGRAGGKERLE